MAGYRKICKNDTKEAWDSFHHEHEQINEGIVEGINKQLSPSSSEVQRLIRKHHTWVGWNPTKQKYITLRLRPSPHL